MSRPVNHGQFVKGRSGNPGGRPRKAKQVPAVTSAFDIVIAKRLTITQGGVAREVTVDEALQHKTYQAAIGGSRLAQRQIMKMIAKREAAITAAKPGQPNVAIRFDSSPPLNANAALQLLGIADMVTDPFSSRLKFKGWIMEAALDRPRRPALGQNDLAYLGCATIDAKAIDWPTPEK